MNQRPFKNTVPKRNSIHICDEEAMRACHFGGKRAVERAGLCLGRRLEEVRERKEGLVDEKVFFQIRRSRDRSIVHFSSYCQDNLRKIT